MIITKSQSAYYLESYVPSSLVSDEQYEDALRKRVIQLAESYDWTIIRVEGPTVLNWSQDVNQPPTDMRHLIVIAVVNEFGTWIGANGDDEVEVDPSSIPLTIQSWAPVGDVLDSCSKCGLLCEIPEPPKDDEVVICDDCKNRKHDLQSLIVDERIGPPRIANDTQ